MLHVAEPMTSPKSYEYVKDCIDKNWFSWKGEYVAKFEEAFAKRVEAKYAVMVSSGTAALEISFAIGMYLRHLRTAKIPNFTFIATLSAALRAGIKPITLNEINKYDLGIENIHSYQDTIICIVPISGLIDWTRFDQINPNKQFYIVDAAQALGTKIPYHAIDVATYSFFANKFISTGEGGMIATNNVHIAMLANEMRSLPSFEYLDETAYPLNLPQTNSRPTNIQAALGLAQLEVLDIKLETHSLVFNKYIQAIKKPGLIFQNRHSNQVPWTTRLTIDNNYWNTPENLNFLIQEKLKLAEIETKPFYTPLGIHPLSKHYLTGTELETAQDFWSNNIQGFYIPTHQNVTDEDIERVAKIINEA